MPELHLIGRLDRSAAWAGGRLADADLRDPFAPLPSSLQGAFAGLQGEPKGRYRLLRDPLGLGKLFWAAAGDAVLVAARPRRLVDAGCAFESIQALPPGTVLDLDLENGSSRVTSLALGDPPRPSAGERVADRVATLGRGIRARLDAVLGALRRAHEAASVFVCLSGGLDSTGIAALARQHWSDVTAVSFDLRRQGGQSSQDRITAERLARDLGLRLLRATVSADQMLDGLDTVLVEGIDWRDFNVHAALVNICLARAIAAAPVGAPGRRLVLTGDLPNEFLVDYQTETYRGRSYYRLPRVRPARQRALLVRGLETSHREIGPFEACGLPVVLPYAAAADLFLALPEEFLEIPGRKDALYRRIFGDLIPDYVYARPKTRAQVGDPDAGSGVLAACVNAGCDGDWLRRRFAELHRVSDAAMLDQFIRAGRYRAGIPIPEGVAA